MLSEMDEPMTRIRCGGFESAYMQLENIESKKFFSQVLTPFDTLNSRRCFPVVARVERLKDQPRSLTLIFVEGDAREAGRREMAELARILRSLAT